MGGLIAAGAMALAVLAHPAVDDSGKILDAIADAGVDGVEAYHAAHTPEQAAQVHAWARQRGLLVTGGSDYHGEPEHPDGSWVSRLGEQTLPQAEWERFAAALEKRAGDVYLK